MVQPPIPSKIQKTFTQRPQTTSFQVTKNHLDSFTIESAEPCHKLLLRPRAKDTHSKSNVIPKKAKGKKSKRKERLEAENAALRARLTVLESGIATVSSVLAGQSSENQLILSNKLMQSLHEPATHLGEKTPLTDLESVQDQNVAPIGEPIIPEDPLIKLVQLMESSLSSFHTLLDSMDQKELLRREKRESKRRARQSASLVK